MNRKAPFLVVLLTACAAGSAWAQEAAVSAAKPVSLTVALIAAAAALAVVGCALATAWAQSRIGAAGAGTIAEKPESSGSIILLVAIPETMVILGFVVAVIMLFTL